MSELIIAGFQDGYTAFLARAALARLQKKLALPRHDLAVLTREQEGEVTLQPVIDLGDRAEVFESFWNILASAIFEADRSSAEVDNVAAARLAAIGIDAMFRQRVTECLVPGSSALLFQTHAPATRDEVLAVLRGFQGEINRTQTTSNERHVWERTLRGTHAEG